MRFPGWAHSLRQCAPESSHSGKGFPIGGENSPRYGSPAHTESGIYAIRICLSELEKKMPVSGQLRRMVCWFTGRGFPIMSVLDELESKLDAAWSNELSSTIYELILILTPLAILLLALH